MTSVISGLLTWFAISATTWLCLFGLDNLLNLPTALRFPFAVVGLVITVASFIKMVVAPMQDHSSDERVALMLEEQFGIEGNVLINTMQFADMGYTDQQKAFINATASAVSMPCSAILGNKSKLLMVRNTKEFARTCATGAEPLS